MDETRLKTLGLLALAEGHRTALHDIEKTLASVLGVKPDPNCPSDYDHISDTVWAGARTADELLELVPPKSTPNEEE